MIKLELTVEECNLILRVLGKHPFEEVVALFFAGFIGFGTYFDNFLRALFGGFVG